MWRTRFCLHPDVHFNTLRFAYVEFAEPEHIDAALTMDNSLFRGRLIKVSSRYILESFWFLTNFAVRLQQNALISLVSTEVEAEEGIEVVTEVDIVAVVMGTAPIVLVAGECWNGRL